MAAQGQDLDDGSDWLRRRIPVSLRSVEKLRAHLAQMGLSIEEFKKLPMYRDNLKQYPWLADL